MNANTESLHPAIEGLSPKQLWAQFDGLRQQPRASHKEQQAIKWVCDWAETNGFDVTKDEVGNICVKVPASQGATSTETVCLQGHIDMVCKKTETSAHNFDTDAIDLKRDGNSLSANETSAGFDNGLGLSAMMAVATDPDAEHPAMELLFTVDEEDDCSGVDNFDPKALDMKSTKVINLDAEMIGELVVQSAGFHGVEGKTAVDRVEEMPAGGHFVPFEISGLKGGHSGLDIEKPVGNSIIALKDLLQDILPRGAQLVSFNGGDKDNVIPTSARAVVYFPEEATPEAFEPVITKFYHDLTSTFKGVDLNLFGEAFSDGRDVSAMTADTQGRVLKVLDEMPNGVLRMHDDFEGVVGVSSSIGVAKTTQDEFTVGLSARAFNAGRLDEAVSVAKVILEQNGFTAVSKTVLSEWAADHNSPLAKAAREAYKIATGGLEAKNTGANCGLECADVVKKLAAHLGLPADQFEAVAFGPTIHSVHSTNERVEVDTVDVFYKQLVALLGKLAKV